MTDIPEAFRRISEEHIDRILFKHLRTKTSFAAWLFAKAFSNSKLTSIDKAALHRDLNHTVASGDPLAFGENDIELIATILQPDGAMKRVGLLIEDKVDARQGDNQAVRYKARAKYRQSQGDWEDFRCILVAPERYIDSVYPDHDFSDHWDAAISFEEIVQVLKTDRAPLEDINTISGATELANAWNAPVPEAVRFWRDLSLFQRTFHPDVPMFAAPQQGARINVWPSFYENQLRNNKHEVRRRTIQIAYPMGSHISLFIKNIKYEPFQLAVRDILEEGLYVGEPGRSWQSIQIKLRKVNPLIGVQEQATELDELFDAARRLYLFFIAHKQTLLSVPKFK